MRSRNLKPGFFKNEELASLPPLARILFEGLWCFSDREGLFEWRPKRIKAEILPYDKCDIGRLLMSLHSLKFIYKYSVDGQEYGIVPKFHTHQNPHPHEAKSIIPPPNQEILEQIQCHGMSVTCNEMSEKCRADIRNPDIRNPDIHRYGEFKNVILTEDEYQKLIKKFGEQGTSIRIENLSEGIASKGYKYKSHYATILSWERKNRGNEDERGPGSVLDPVERLKETLRKDKERKLAGGGDKTPSGEAPSGS